MRFLSSILIFGLLTLTCGAQPAADTSIDFTGTVTYICTNRAVSALNLGASDGTNGILFRVAHETRLPEGLAVGLRARFRGTVEQASYGRRFAVLTACEALGFAEPPVPVGRTIAELMASEDYYRLTRLTGTLTDVTYASDDRLWIMCELTDGNNFVFVNLPAASAQDLVRLSALVGSRVAVIGLCVPYDHSPRVVTGKLFKAASVDSISKLEQPPESSDADLPLIQEIRDARPAALADLGRHRARGRVLATWMGNMALLRTDNGAIVGVEFVPGTRLPAVGDVIEAVGLPETDLFRINLYAAAWHGLPQTAGSQRDPTPLHIASLLQTSARGLQHFTCSPYHGREITFDGRVRSNPPDDPNATMHVESEGLLIPVDASTHPDALATAAVGCRVRVTGICVLDIDSPHRANSLAFRTRALRVVVRGADDVLILSRPSWWTPERLLAVIGALLAALLGIVIWNRSLRHLVERRSRELFRSQIETMTSELRVEERTRLAVELHDALSQNLTGISFQVDMAERLSRPEQTDLANHLTIASRTLLSCRDELRNCIYDLRNQALDLPNLEEAIRVTLRPHLGDTQLNLRFNVPRAHLTDKTTHTILRIVRELVTNAVRHGHAAQVSVAGAIEGSRLKMSVKDDGCGFDPENRPGMAEGHFGLQGIKERIRLYAGKLAIDSRPGRGTRVSVELHLQSKSSGKEQNNE